MAPEPKLDSRYSDPVATAISWQDAQNRLADAETAWLVTVRPDGRPHSTPLVTVWHEGKVYFHTGEREQKMANLRQNPQVLVMAGDTRWDAGVDIAVEGVARQVTDQAVLQAIADLYAKRWDGRWELTVGEGGFVDAGSGGVQSVPFEVTPTKVYAYAKGDPFGQTSYQMP
ncbi:MAG TPA: pyridoxamine 5'-phosphate oxidase family protein [Pseudonocardiaceae bacterium]|nr:pyridoxamine 5'-phosphate oxidase family protein [Pseudonocardiaceae bacterium]